MNIMNSEIFFDKYIHKDFEEQYVPKIFESICKQYLIRQNKAGKINPSFTKIGKYYYDDPINKTNGEFDVVTEDEEGFSFYECKFKNSPITEDIIQKEIQQVISTGLLCAKYGFFSRSAFSCRQDKNMVLIPLSELYK